MTAGTRLMGRDEEVGRLGSLLAELKDGAGAALVLVGDPGIGKTALLGAAHERAVDSFTVLRAGGVRGEAEIAFSGLSDLLGEVVDRLGSLPLPQADALRAALALGPAVPGDRLAVCVATLGLLHAAARTRPVLVLVDDLPWLDAPSREAVLYAARRAGAGVSFLLALRAADADPVELAGLAQLALAPLDARASRQVLARHEDLAPGVVDVIVEASAGNPLALRELPAVLIPVERTGVQPLPDPLMPGARWQATFAHRVQRLPVEAQRVLLLAAVHQRDDVATLATAAAGLQTDVRHLTDAEEAGLVRLDGPRVTFVHPLMRGAVVGTASAPARREAHRALAGALTGERRAWHLGCATVAPDEEVAVELEQAAGAAAARRGYASAAVALERAARLSPEPGARARRMLAAAQTAAAAGLPGRASALLDEVLAEVDESTLRRRVVHLRAATMIWTGEARRAVELLEAEAAAAATCEPVLAARMLADAATACTAISEYARAEVVVERAVATLSGTEDQVARAHVTAVHAYVLALRGRFAAAREALRSADALAAGLDPLVPGRTWLHLVERTRAPLGDPVGARSRALALCERAREAGAVTVLAGSLVVAADSALRLGKWDEADAACAEAIHVSQDAAQQVWCGFALTIRARILAVRGDEAGARALLWAAGRIADDYSLVSGHRFVDGTTGFLELGLGNAAATIATLERLAPSALASGLRESTIVPWIPDLVEAYLRLERLDDARLLVERLAGDVEHAPPAARALLMRCRGLLEPGYDTLFAEAVGLHEAAQAPFERARTLLAWGRRLHRSRRRAEACARLDEAARTFEDLAAAPWVRQARDELSAARARRTATPGAPLTGQEERVAAEVARGASNGEIAAALFLSPKTVEFHLTRIYRKLGVASRPQLVALLGRRGGGF